MGKAIYAIDAFPDDAQLWRIDWIGGVAYNASVPSEPLIDVCLARLPKGERNPLSARSRCSETKFVAKIGVGLLPFISTASVWLQQDRAVQPGFFGNVLIGSLDFERRDGHEIRYRNSPLVNRMIGLCLRNRNTFESPLPNFPRDDRLEPRAIDNNKAPLPPTNDSARGEFD